MISTSTKTTSAPSGGEQAGAGGAAGQDLSAEGAGDDDDSEGNERPVSYPTYNRTLTQLKNAKTQKQELAEENARLKAELEGRDRAKLEEQGDYQKLLSAERERAKALEVEASAHKQKLNEFVKRETDARKFVAFVDALGVDIDRELASYLVNLDEIAMDPDSGEVDKVTLSRYAESFRKKWPKVVAMSVPGAGLPNGKPGAGRMGPEFITRSEFVKLCRTDTKAAHEWAMRNRQNPGAIIEGK